ncbi:MAG: FmdB family zinc ribbon protein [Candidatus Limnocylindria bacterium]
MPTYDYQCRACGTVTEVIHSMLDDGPSVCELCGGALRRVLYPTGIIFKGSGFYRNDSRASSASSVGGSDKGDGSDKAGKPDKNGGSSIEQKPGSTTPDGGSSDSKSAATDASST